MATSRITKWNSDDVYTNKAEIHTRMFDMGDPHAKKKINSFFITFTGATNQSFIGIKISYRFHNNDSWKFFGAGTASGTSGRRADINPIYNSASNYQMEKENTSDGDIVRIKDVYTIQFKLNFVATNKVEINDYAIEYRTVRSNSISEPEV